MLKKKNFKYCRIWILNQNKMTLWFCALKEKKIYTGTYIYIYIHLVCMPCVKRPYPYFPLLNYTCKKTCIIIYFTCSLDVVIYWTLFFYRPNWRESLPQRSNEMMEVILMKVIVFTSYKQENTTKIHFFLWICLYIWCQIKQTELQNKTTFARF